MADNKTLPSTGTGTANIKVATDEVTYSGDSGVDVQLIRQVQVTGTEGSKTVVDSATPVTGTSASITVVAHSASVQTAMASNAARKGLLIFNDANQIAYVKFGSTATTSDHSFQLPAGATYEMGPNIYSGIVTFIWAADPTGNMRSTEW